MALNKLEANSIVPINEVELFKQLSYMAAERFKQKAQEEEDFGDDIPADYLGMCFFAPYVFFIQFNFIIVFCLLLFISFEEFENSRVFSSRRRRREEGRENRTFGLENLIVPSVRKLMKFVRAGSLLSCNCQFCFFAFKFSLVCLLSCGCKCPTKEK